jgi:hypothetical protein
MFLYDLNIIRWHILASINSIFMSKTLKHIYDIDWNIYMTLIETYIWHNIGCQVTEVNYEFWTQLCSLKMCVWIRIPRKYVSGQVRVTRLFLLKWYVSRKYKYSMQGTQTKFTGSQIKFFLTFLFFFSWKKI